ncbi:MAG TPA: imelysin family protein [Puia sp.]|nr:imelysin family protein [Puia sp.]
MIKYKHITSTLSACLILSGLTLSSCSKSSDSGSGESFTDLEKDVITNFVNNVAIIQYADLAAKATDLKNNIIALDTATVTRDARLQLAQTSWKTLRQTWERCEGFLIGPVEDNDYDPNSDTWPTDYTQMDALLAGSNPLTTADVEALDPTLRGYHPIEYMLFGEGGSRKASELDARKKKYLVSLSDDLLNNNIKPLLASWQGASGYGNTVLTAGAGNASFSSRQRLFLDLVGDNGMAGICNEVGQQNDDGKIYNPYNLKDSSYAESPYSGNSLIDFKNNIIGAQQVYLGNGAKGFKDLVTAKNKNLDSKIQAAFTAAINSFDNISGADNMRFELAIYQRRTQIQATLAAINNLQTLLEDDLSAYITQNVKD